MIIIICPPPPPFAHLHHFHYSAHHLLPFPSCPPLDIFNYEIPSINVNLDSLIDEFSGAPCRRSLAVTDSPEGDALAEEEPQSTILWPMTLRHPLPATPRFYTQTYTPPSWLNMLFLTVAEAHILQQLAIKFMWLQKHKNAMEEQLPLRRKTGTQISIKLHMIFF